MRGRRGSSLISEGKNEGLGSNSEIEGMKTENLVRQVSNGGVCERCLELGNAIAGSRILCTKVEAANDKLDT